MMPKPCKIHNNRSFILTSPYFAKAIGQGEKISIQKRRYIQIETDGKVYSYCVDKGFFEQQFPDEKSNTIFLKDRDIELKKLNDRLLVLKIKKELCKVCPECLENIFYSD